MRIVVSVLFLEIEYLTEQMVQYGRALDSFC